MGLLFLFKSNFKSINYKLEPPGLRALDFVLITPGVICLIAELFSCLTEGIVSDCQL